MVFSILVHQAFHEGWGHRLLIDNKRTRILLRPLAMILRLKDREQSTPRCKFQLVCYSFNVCVNTPVFPTLAVTLSLTSALTAVPTHTQDPGPRGTLTIDISTLASTRHPTQSISWQTWFKGHDRREVWRKSLYYHHCLWSTQPTSWGCESSRNESTDNKDWVYFCGFHCVASSC